MKIWVAKHIQTGKYWNGELESILRESGNHLVSRDDYRVEFRGSRLEIEDALKRSSKPNLAFNFLPLRLEDFKIVRWKGNLAQDLILRKIWWRQYRQMI